MRNPEKLWYLAAALFLVALLAAAPFPPSAAAQADVDSCETVRLPASEEATPQYTLGGLWAGDPGRQSLVLVEPGRRSLALFDRGRRPAAPPQAVMDSLASLRPVGAAALPGGGLLVQGSDGRFAELSPDLTRVPGTLRPAEAAGLAELFPYRWEVVGPDPRRGGLMVCGDVRTGPDAEWKSGIFYVPLSAGSDHRFTEILAFEDLRDLNRLWCRLGGQLFAEANGDPYVLLLSGVHAGGQGLPQIYRIDLSAPAGKRLKPLELRDRPAEMTLSPNQLTKTQWSSAEFADLMREVEGLTMPTEMVSGSAAGDDALYLVLRDGSDFRIARVEPGAGDTARVTTSRVDSDAHHLSLIPGAERFAIVEKHAAKSLGDHPIRDFRLVPSSLVAKMGDDQPLCR